jgi:hypothetical protein
MPFGLQVIGGFRGDARLLACATAMEHAFNGQLALRRPRPDLDKLRRSTVDLKSIVTDPPLMNATTPTAEGASAV